MTRFFAAPSVIKGDTIKLSEDDAAHIHALRMRPTDRFIVCDGNGSDYVCSLGASGMAAIHGGAVAKIIEKRRSGGEPTVACDVFMALAKGDRMDYAVQKSVELGARSVTVFPCRRCVAIPGDMDSKTARLQRIALETAKQCGRGIVPVVKAAGSFMAAVGQASGAQLPLFFYECEEELSLKQALSQSGDASTAAVVTGPEGGFEPEEADRARAAGMLTVTMGPRILRCETAPAAALAVIMYHTGNL